MGLIEEYLMKRRKSESGQAAILLAMGMIGLLAFTALAIDGGNMYLQKRNAQNAADAGSVAGTRELHRLLHTDPLIGWPEKNVDLHLVELINEFAESNGVPDTDPGDVDANANVEAYYLDIDGNHLHKVGEWYDLPEFAVGIEVIAHIPFSPAWWACRGREPPLGPGRSTSS